MKPIKLFWISWLFLPGLLTRSLADDALHAGFLYDEFPLTLDSGYRTEALGPFFYFEEKETRKTWAVPPLLSHSFDPATESEEFDFVYPILTYARFGAEYRWQLMQVLSFSGGKDPDDAPRDRFTLFPLYFQQRSTKPQENYTAFFPIYGDIKNRFWHDDIFFVLFPLYSKTRKADVVTRNYLYPIFDVRHGNALNGWQFWPLYGEEHKTPTTRTNGFGDVQIVGGHDNFFALWPIFFNDRTDIGTDNPQHQQAALPFYSYLRSPQRDTTTVIWPLFNYIDDREKKYHEWEMPWPIIVFARGEGKTTSRVFPFFSQSQSTNLESDFYLWPIYKYNRVHSDPLDRERTRILFFLYSDVREKNTETDLAIHRVDFFPFYTYRRDFNGKSRLQIFAILEPFLPNNTRIERDYSPLWSVWRSEKNPESGASSQSLLWNLYRHESAPSAKKCSLLFGLFQYQSNPEGKRVRLFYIPVVKTKKSAAGGETK